MSSTVLFARKPTQSFNVLAKVVSIRAIASFALICVGLCGTKARGEALDIHDDGAYCSDLSAKAPSLALKYVTPTWEKEAKIASVGQPTELDSIVHNLNSEYLRSMVDSTYLRLSAAREAGMDLALYKKGFSAIEAFCSKPDASGHSLAREAARLTRLPDEVDADFSSFGLMSQDPQHLSEMYFRRLVVAAIEVKRIHRLLTAIKMDAQNVKPDAERSAQLKDLTMIHMLRLLRLQHRYPALVAIGTFSGADRLETMIENAFGTDLAITQMPLGAQFYTDPILERKLGLNPAGKEPAAMPEVHLLTQTQEESGARTYYASIYSEILSGRRSLPFGLVDQLKAYLDLSVRESISSAVLKCQNVSPCRAFATNPLLAAAKIDQAGKNDEYGPIACACHIGQQHQWLSNKQNIGLGLVSATAVLVATVYPVNWVVLLAYGLATADAGGVVAGLNDNYKNVARTNQVALFRAGGAVPPLYEFDIQNDYANQKYQTVINVITSALSLAPPARILARPAGVTARDVVHSHEFITQSKVEFGKTALSLPPPDTGWKAYQASTDPRNDLAPISPLLRLRYPKFAAELDAAASSPSDISLRDRDFRISKMKQEAREKIAKGLPPEI